MAIIQKIEYKSENRYFDGFLQNAIESCGIKGCIDRIDNHIWLIIEDDNTKESLEKFAEFTSKYLPHSIFLGSIDTANGEADCNGIDKIKSKPYPISPCPICLEELTNPASNRYLDDTICCTHYSNDKCCEYIDNTTFSPHYNGYNTILLTDSSKIKELFLVTENEIEALFSIEKPILKVTIKDKELQQIVGKKYMNLQAPYSIKSALVALNAKESDIDTLFFDTDNNSPKLIVVQNHKVMIYDNPLSKQLEKLNDNRVLNRFANIMKEADYSVAIGAYMSHTHGISFPVATEHGIKEAIVIDKFDSNKVLNLMQNDEKRAKLLKNFEKNSNSAYSNFINKMQNGATLFEVISAITSLNETSYEAVSSASLDFHGNGGLKVDMFFSEDGFDYASLLGSLISFKIAGVENSYLLYSLFEAWGDMVVSVLGQLKSEFKVSNFIMMGDMFENSVLFSRILSKFTISKPYFSQQIALDSID